jgi:hypothetical protein
VSKPTTKKLEKKIEDTLMLVMNGAEKTSEKISAAAAAIKFLAVRLKVGPEFGGSLDDD